MTIPMSEPDMQLGIEQAARLGGWDLHHDRPVEDASTGRWMTHISSLSTAGFPDLVLRHRDRGTLLVIECKSADGRTTADQDAWLDAFRRAGIDTRIIRPPEYDALVEELLGPRMLRRIRRTGVAPAWLRT
jgi:hypothetical protein